MDAVHTQGQSTNFMGGRRGFVWINGYDRSLHQLTERATRLILDVSQMLERSLQSLYTQNNLLAQEVLRHDDVVDDATTQIEEDSLQLISIQQPRQKDVRVLAVALRNARDWERIADYSGDIAEITEILAGQPYCISLHDMERMGTLSLDMISQAVEAVSQQDSDLARQGAARDNPVDRLYRTLHAGLMDTMRYDSRTVDQARHWSLVARYLERIADHAVNIAEMAVFMENGKHRPFHPTSLSAGDAHG
jgi:phosphate transport system protein